MHACTELFIPAMERERRREERFSDFSLSFSSSSFSSLFPSFTVSCAYSVLFFLADRGGDSCIPRLPVLFRLFFFLHIRACRPPVDEEAMNEKITSALTLRNPSHRRRERSLAKLSRSIRQVLFSATGYERLFSETRSRSRKK